MERIVSTLACLQLAQLIEKDKHADLCRAEWRRRWGAEYPEKGARGNGQRAEGADPPGDP
jgi:hypothetical protein